MEERAGLVFFAGATLPVDSPISDGAAKLFIRFPSNPNLIPVNGAPPTLSYLYDMKEFEFVPAIVERFRKSKVRSFIEETYETTISYDIFCTRYGKPYTGERQFTFSPINFGDDGGITNYVYLDKVRSNIQKLIDNGGADYAGKTVDEIITEYYGGPEILQKINESAVKVVMIHNRNPDNWAYLLPHARNSTQVWAVQPHQSTDKTSLTVAFKDGKGSFNVEPNYLLNEDTNPRREVLSSICLAGSLSDAGGLSTDFTALFFHNPSPTKNSKK